jgi:hypothetical protein
VPSRTFLLVVALVLGSLAGLSTSCQTYTEAAGPLDVDAKPEGEGWYCTWESSGMLSVCERTTLECGRARRYMAKRFANRGELLRFTRCRPREQAVCYTASRKLVSVAEEEASSSNEDDDEGEDEDSEDDVLRETIWNCHSTQESCEWGRLNMYQDGFTDVSRCRKWK